MGFVYFITTTAAIDPGRAVEAVKIGYTGGDPYGRLKSLQTGCPTPLVLTGYYEGAPDDERELHRRFASARITGEWFNLEDDDVFMEFLRACEWAGEYEGYPVR